MTVSVCALQRKLAAELIFVMLEPWCVTMCVYKCVCDTEGSFHSAKRGLQTGSAAGFQHLATVHFAG